MMPGIQFYENGMPNIMANGGIMLKLSEFRHNHHPSGVKKLAKFIRRGIPVTHFLPVQEPLVLPGSLFD